MKKFFYTFFGGILTFALVIWIFSSIEKKSDKKYRICMVTDSAEVNDDSFNQSTYEGCKFWCDQNGFDFNYFKPNEATDSDRLKFIEIAIERGYNVIVCPGYIFGPVMKDVVFKHPDIHFACIDVAKEDLGEDFEPPENFVSYTFNEAVSGYLAGYATIKEGFRNVGFLGGIEAVSVKAYGYGFLQGIDAAANELENQEPGMITMKYSYAGQFYGDNELTMAMDGWYKNGTEVVFSCGGGIYTSVALAAKENKGFVIGVDTDQSYAINSTFGEGICITSALKGIKPTVNNYLDNLINENVDIPQGIIMQGIVTDEDLSLNYVGIPTETWSFKNFTIDEYRQVVSEILYGKRLVSRNTDEMPRVSTLIEEFNLTYVK